MCKPWLALVCAALSAAIAAEGEEPKPKPKPTRPKEEPALPTPTDEEVDKPSKPGVPRPIEIPTKGEATAADKEKVAPADKEKAYPAGQGASHVNPFGEKAKLPKYARPARITYSDKKVVEGFVWHRGDAPARIFNRAKRAHEDYFLSDLKRIDVTPESENFERDWRWKNQGSSEKVYLDTGYFWNQYITTFTLTSGEKVAGDCSGQFYIQLLDGKRESWFLYKRQSGRELPGVPHKKREELQPLVYVKSVEFTDDFLKRPADKKE